MVDLGGAIRSSSNPEHFFQGPGRSRRESPQKCVCVCLCGRVPMAIRIGKTIREGWFHHVHHVFVTITLTYFYFIDCIWLCVFTCFPCSNIKPRLMVPRILVGCDMGLYLLCRGWSQHVLSFLCTPGCFFCGPGPESTMAWNLSHVIGGLCLSSVLFKGGWSPVKSTTDLFKLQTLKATSNSVGQSWNTIKNPLCKYILGRVLINSHNFLQTRTHVHSSYHWRRHLEVGF